MQVKRSHSAPTELPDHSDYRTPPRKYVSWVEVTAKSQINNKLWKLSFLEGRKEYFWKKVMLGLCSKGASENPSKDSDHCLPCVYEHGFPIAFMSHGFSGLFWENKICQKLLEIPTTIHHRSSTWRTRIHPASPHSVGGNCCVSAPAFYPGLKNELVYQKNALPQRFSFNLPVLPCHLSASEQFPFLQLNRCVCKREAMHLVRNLQWIVFAVKIN